MSRQDQDTSVRPRRWPPKARSTNLPASELDSRGHVATRVVSQVLGAISATRSRRENGANYRRPVRRTANASTISDSDEFNHCSVSGFAMIADSRGSPLFDRRDHALADHRRSDDSIGSPAPALFPLPSPSSSRAARSRARRSARSKNVSPVSTRIAASLLVAS